MPIDIIYRVPVLKQEKGVLYSYWISACVDSLTQTITLPNGRVLHEKDRGVFWMEKHVWSNLVENGVRPSNIYTSESKAVHRKLADIIKKSRRATKHNTGKIRKNKKRRK